jgi:hypothetical protein
VRPSERQSHVTYGVVLGVLVVDVGAVVLAQVEGRIGEKAVHRLAAPVELELLHPQWGAPGQLVQPTIEACYDAGLLMAGLHWQLFDWDPSQPLYVQVRLGDGAKTVLRTPREPIGLGVGYNDRGAAWEITVHELTPGAGQ